MASIIKKSNSAECEHCGAKLTKKAKAGWAWCGISRKFVRREGSITVTAAWCPLCKEVYLPHYENPTMQALWFYRSQAMNQAGTNK